MTEYSTIKTIAQTIYGDSIGAGSFVESDSGSPTELAILLDFVHSRIASYPREWPFLKTTGTITSTGATSYDLKTLFPDFLSIYQVYGIDSNIEHTYRDNADANITPLQGWTIRNGVLVFTGTTPISGTTIRIQYKGQYLVEDSSGTRKRYFEDSDDVSVIPVADQNVLIFGLGEYVDWKKDEVSQNKRIKTSNWFTEAWTNMLLRNEVSRPLTSMI